MAELQLIMILNIASRTLVDLKHYVDYANQGFGDEIIAQRAELREIKSGSRDESSSDDEGNSPDDDE